MSKLYEKYKNLKSENATKLYLFKSGIFYIFLDEDAIKMSNLLNLKLTNLNETIVKCGFLFMFIYLKFWYFIYIHIFHIFFKNFGKLVLTAGGHNEEKRKK